jgi:hypothetical protein
MKTMTKKLFFIICIQVLFGLQQVYAATYYVSPTGVDTNVGTSLSTPVKTITKALSKATLSGDIVYVMTGTYVETVNISQSGITLSAYPNNSPIIDGGTTLPSGDWGVLLNVAGNNNSISGFEVRNSNVNGAHLGGFGIQLVGHHNTVSKVNVHHAWEQGIYVHGDYNIVEDSSIWQNARHNSASPGSVVWGTGISAARNQSAAAIKPGITSYAILRRNKVFNNWGEGISCFETDHSTMEDNVSYDNWTVNMYISDTTNSLVQRNIIYVSSTPAIATRNNSHPGVLFADEVASVPRSANNTFINNFIYNANLDAYSWTGVANSGLNNTLIANNTIVDGNVFIGAGGSPAIVNVNSQIRNNIIFGKTSTVTNSNGLTFSDNNWAVTPAAAKSNTDIVGDPQITRTGTTTAGTLTSAYFKIITSSPVIDVAMPLTNVVEDFFKTPRTATPDIGAYEVPSSGTPTPTPTPTPPTTTTTGTIYYVSPTGVDTNNGTSLSTPVKTITKALSKAQTSGDIIYVMTGTYVESVTIAQSGITLSAYPNNSPVIDGTSTLPSIDWGVLINVVGNNNSIAGFEVKNSNSKGAHLGGYGIQLVGHHNTVNKVNVHHAWEEGIVVNGDYNIVQDSTVWQNSIHNSTNAGTVAWATGISAAGNKSSAALKPGITSYPTFQRNTVFNNWGEGIACYQADNCIIQDNVSYDNWTINLYLSDSTNSLVQRNIVYDSSAPAISTRNSSHPGMLLADEVSTAPRSANNTIINNFIYNAGLDAFSWTGVANSGLNNTLIANNTIVDGNLFTGAGGTTAIVNVNAQIRNNIVLGTTSTVPNNTGITFSNNNWAVTPVAAKSTTDVVGNPQIARTGTVTSGTLTSSYFKLLTTSPVINLATPIAAVKEDFFKTARGATLPDIGANEAR